MQLTLTAPDGSAVQLVGTNGSCNTWTPIALWDVLFVPCSAGCLPDTLNGCAYPCSFDGCPSGCPWANANYSGSYHPFQGCLEDFDSGPVNGQWCLSIDNNAQFNGGVILDFQVILCDQSGILCCAADGGNLAFEPDLTACEGDSALRLSPEPIYGALVPDTTLHGYVYLVFEDTVLTALENLPNLDTYPPGTYEVCGLSYLYGDSTELPVAGTVLTPFGLDTMLHGPSPAFCGDVTDDCILVRIASPPAEVQLSRTICEGDTIQVGGSQYTSSGQYLDTLHSYFGCDSIVSLDLVVLPADTTFLTVVGCAGSTYLVGDSVYTVSGSYTNRLVGSNGCDSTVRLDLTVIPTILTILKDTICSGDTVWMAGQPYYESGMFVDTLPSTSQCDSIVTLDLSVVSLSVEILPPDTLTCVDTVIELTTEGVSTVGPLLYSWAWEGSPVGTPDTTGRLVVTAAGLYIVEASSGTCQVRDSALVHQDTLVPVVILDPPFSEQLDCATMSLILEGVAIGSPADLIWQWTESTGAGFTNISPQSIQVSMPGEYELTVTDTANGCVSTLNRSIMQDTVRPVALAGPDTMFSCQQAIMQLDGTLSQLNSNAGSYQWTVLEGGSIIPPTDTIRPTIDGPGIYELVVTDLANQCTDKDTIVIWADTIAPIPILATPQGTNLTCTVSSVTLDATGSTVGPDYTATWIGDIQAGQGTLYATVHLPGTYVLVLKDNSNGCTDSISLTIGLDTLAPMVEAGVADTLSCTNNTSSLGGAGTSVGPTYSYQWTGSAGGSFISPTDMPTAEVDSAGTYHLFVMDLSNGCEAWDSVVIAGNYQPPQAEAGPDELLTCTEPQVVLNAAGSLIVPFSSYYWTDVSGELISNELTVTVAYADTFIFHLSFAFCEDRDTVLVTGPGGLPVVEAGIDVPLDCMTGQVQLNGAGSEEGSQITYAWELLGGGGQGIVQGGQTLEPLVDMAGLYQLTVTDGESACSATDTVLVWLDTAACLPAVWAGADGLVNCYHQQFADTLAAAGSEGPHISANWTVISGAVLDASNVYQPIVTPGTYILTVTNEAVGLGVQDTVIVFADTVAPIAHIDNETLSLDCTELAACYVPITSGTTEGPGIVYAWGTFDGSFCGPTDVLATGISQVGIYELIVTDLGNGCTAGDAIFITLEDVPSVANAGTDLQLPCSDTTIVPNPAGSSVGVQFQYNWYSGDGGIVISGGNTLQPQLAVMGPSDTFYLEVINTANSCRDTDAVVVFGPTGCTPQCVAEVEGQLDCLSATATVSGLGSSQGVEISYQWTTGGSGGSFCGNPVQQQVCVDSPGEYILTVTRTYPSGVQFNKTCEVVVTDLSNPPVTSAGLDRTLNCTDTVVFLDGSASASGTGISYQWASISGGSISGGAASAIAEVDRPGTYVLTVMDSTTGCESLDTVSVTQDTLPPVADAGLGGMLNCLLNTIVLSGSGTPAGVMANWDTPDGDICAGATTFNPIVCDAGTYLLTVTDIGNGCQSTDSVLVTIDGSVPNPDAGPDLVYTCVDQIFEIEASVAGGNNLAYAWTAMSGGCIVGPADQLQPTVACPGVYQLQVTDLSNGCQGYAEVEVTADTVAPVADPGMPQEIDCDQLIVTLDGSGSQANGGVLYAWSVLDSGNLVGGGQFAAVQADAAGNYQLEVTSVGNGCRDTAIVSVTVDEGLPSVSAGMDTVLTCRYDTLVLDGGGTSVWPGLVYSWVHLGGGNLSDGQTLVPVVWLPGSYELTVTDTLTGCTVKDTAMVGADTVSPVAHIDANEGIVLNCDLGQLMFDGQSSEPAGGLAFHWETQGGHILSSSALSVIEVDSGGTYLLVVENLQNGCRDTAEVMVEENREAPKLVMGAAGLLTCREPTDTIWVSTDGAHIVYEWSGPGLVSGEEEAYTVVNQAGAYQVVVMDTVNGCESVGWVSVGQDFTLPVAVVQALGSFTCKDSTVVVSGYGSTEGAVAYEWRSAGGTGISEVAGYSVTVTEPGWYYLTVERLDNGCTATDSTEVSVSVSPISGLVLDIGMPDCENPEGFIRVDSVLGGMAPYVFALDEGYFAPYRVFEYLDPGAYRLMVEDASGCRWEEWVDLVLPEEILVDLGTDLSIRLGDSVRLEGLTNRMEEAIDTVMWRPEAVGGCGRCLAIWVDPLETTTYYLTVVDTNGCQATDKVIVFVEQAGEIYAPTAFSPDGDGTNDYFTLYGGSQVAGIQELSIYDRWGSLVYAGRGMMPNNPLEGWDGTFGGRPLDAAVFVWKAVLVMHDGSPAVRWGTVALVR